jgi:hypothetical protein
MSDEHIDPEEWDRLSKPEPDLRPWTEKVTIEDVVGHTFEVTRESFDEFVAGIDKPDMVNHPPHYTAHPSGVECIQVTEHMNFCVGNAVKYLWRADLKNGIEDLEKAAWYVAREIERRNQGETS